MPTPTALIADDEEAPRAQLQTALRTAWPELQVVQECANGIDAWDAFLEHEPQVCFLDVRMPGFTGIEVAQRIGGGAYVVFVAVSGDHVLSAFEAGAADHVLKPINEGSSVGVAIVTDGGNYGNPIARGAAGPWQEFAELLAEPFIKGRELTVAVLGGKALCVTELKPKSGFYDFDAKYTDGMTQHICPAQIPADIEDYMMELALSAHELLGCKGASRSDFRWDEEQGEAGLYLLEVNTQPGMTPLSLVPEQARLKGIEYGELVERLIAEALA